MKIILYEYLRTRANYICESMNSKNNKPIITEISGLRGAAILSVLLSHVFIFPEIAFYEYEPAFLFGVPMFIFISGFVLSYNNNIGEYSIKEFYIKRIINTGIPYLIWTLIYAIIYLLPFENLSSVIPIYVYNTFTGRWPNLWFIIVIFQLYFLFPLLNKIFNSFKFIVQLLMTLCLFCLTLIVYNTPYYYIIYNSFIEKLIKIPPWSFFFPWLVYFLIGMFAGHNIEYFKIIIRNKRVQFITLIIYLIYVFMLPGIEINTGIPYGDYFIPHTLILSILSIILLYNLYNYNFYLINKIGTTFQFIGKYSFGIYLSHKPINSIINMMFNNIQNIFNITFLNKGHLSLLILFLVISISIKLTSILWKIPYGEYIIGKKYK